MQVISGYTSGSKPADVVLAALQKSGSSAVYGKMLLVTIIQKTYFVFSTWSHISLVYKKLYAYIVINFKIFFKKEIKGIFIYFIID